MSRNTRSDTYIKAGSDSSYDSDECSRRYAEPHLEGYCCMGRISIKKAAMIAGIFSVIQLVLNFCLFLTAPI
ncbi:hypothetical protein WR25_17876 [Diploscapter pachys]|uniref:Uncharacterized protein n=1 Tax=Diploscapter pachys TaxID=2018661 RepID=A0A2A2JSN6_9BILA|nr:hypothetical protein WR25_17876 [Diploscapter pachys]